jgi:hypothetical protein
MSGYLWGIGQLVNDPSPHLFNAIQKHILQKRETVCTASSSAKPRGKPSLNIIECQSKNVLDQNSDAGCIKISSSKNVCKEKRTKSSTVQVGSGGTRRRHISTQYRGGLKKLDRSTSAKHVHYFDCSTVISCVNIRDKPRTKDTETNTCKPSICNNHRHVLLTISDSATLEKLRFKKSNDNFMIKNMVNSILDNFKLDKIENIPPYKPNKIQFLKLYSGVSLDNMKLKKNKPAKNI